MHWPTALVTGASSGIGAGLARALLAEGGQVFLAARSRDRLQALAAAFPDRAHVLEMDVTRPETVAAAARAVERQAPNGLDLVIAAAGYGYLGRALETPADDARKMFATNVLGLIETARGFVPLLEKKRGTFAAVSSLAGLTSAPNMAVYCSSKFAVRGFLDGLRFEIAKRGVAVVEVCPGAVNTGLFGEGWTGKLPRSARMFPMLEVDEVVRVTLAAARKRRPRTTFPFWAWLLSWTGNVAPAVGRPVQRWIEGE